MEINSLNHLKDKLIKLIYFGKLKLEMIFIIIIEYLKKKCTFKFKKNIIHNSIINCNFQISKCLIVFNHNLI